jgi:hypothetical protein
MRPTHIIKTRVTADVKERVTETAKRELLTEALWLRRLVAGALCSSLPSVARDSRPRPSCKSSDREPCRGKARLNISLRLDDRLLLQARAEARGMPEATYATVLLRAHLRNLAPLPRDELAALKRSNAELGTIGRNLNQLARIAHQTGRITGPGRDDLRSMLKVCEAMREHVKGLIRANLESWESGHAEARN